MFTTTRENSRDHQSAMSRTICTFLLRISISVLLLSDYSLTIGQPGIIKITDNAVIVDNGRVGLILPPRSRESDKAFTEALKELKPSLLLIYDADTLLKDTPQIFLSKSVADTIIPMEIVFIENCVKVLPELDGKRSTLLDFGVFDIDGRRYRYKTIQPPDPSDGHIKMMFYFMKDDYSNSLYELGIIFKKEYFDFVEPMIISIAASFEFLEP
ncbi:MAG TPA: hypothetical protein PLR01_08150 [Bacteroidales bacterium]|jgi:hypothetical protein|nr:hypothetical protein [Bacteroidales bacterium]HPI86331.1 hypothetical protein [Bacteroidales bacterium]